MTDSFDEFDIVRQIKLMDARNTRCEAIAERLIDGFPELLRRMDERINEMNAVNRAREIKGFSRIILMEWQLWVEEQASASQEETRKSINELRDRFRFDFPPPRAPTILRSRSIFDRFVAHRRLRLLQFTTTIEEMVKSLPALLDKGGKNSRLQTQSRAHAIEIVFGVGKPADSTTILEVLQGEAIAELNENLEARE